MSILDPGTLLDRANVWEKIVFVVGLLAVTAGAFALFVYVASFVSQAYETVRDLPKIRKQKSESDAEVWRLTRRNSELTTENECLREELRLLKGGSYRGEHADKRQGAAS